MRCGAFITWVATLPKRLGLLSIFGQQVLEFISVIMMPRLGLELLGVVISNTQTPTGLYSALSFSPPLYHSLIELTFDMRKLSHKLQCKPNCFA